MTLLLPTLIHSTHTSWFPAGPGPVAGDTAADRADFPSFVDSTAEQGNGSFTFITTQPV